jgi:FKBP-type peptidyl-prolyl cis-trans isomerase
MCKEYGTYDANRAMQNGYNPFPFRPKDGMIPDFRGLSLVNYGDKAIIFLPASLGYGERGAGGVILKCQFNF